MLFGRVVVSHIGIGLLIVGSEMVVELILDGVECLTGRVVVLLCSGVERCLVFLLFAEVLFWW